MAIKIFTYPDPYKLHNEEYWSSIIDCPYFCASQTLVNGLKGLYKTDFSQGRVTTVQNLIESLFATWESTSCIVKQHTAIDNIITAGIPNIIESDLQANMMKALLFNRDELFDSIRTLFELKVSLEEILVEKLTKEQRIAIEIYKQIISSEKRSDFILKDDLDEKTIDEAICNAMEKANRGKPVDEVNMNRIVIHGIHQFTPILLRAIEEISKYKDIILLFNYQAQYKEVYQTWIDIYSAFDSPIVLSKKSQFHPSKDLSRSYSGNILADNLGKLVGGNTAGVMCSHGCEIVEFDNTTEFANYVAGIFLKAEREDPSNPLSKMREQIYAADRTVNDILKIYFPEQFGERQFLNYPLGHFFVSVANMWNANENILEISDLNDIKECLGAGILKEDHPGHLLSIFGQIESIFEGCTSLTEMQGRLNRIKKNQRFLAGFDQKESIERISYYAVPLEDISVLKQALSELGELAEYFYEDFEKQPDNFRRFYKRLKRYLQSNILEERELNEEYSDIIRRVLERLEQVENIGTSASFECLKSTMSIYLVQETKPGKSANWIVRDFEQIDGDILRSLEESEKNKDVTYHFACLTDEDIDSVKRNIFPWPLDDAFFEVAQEPVDWKYQVYVRSKKEYRNFKRYALIYGLEFNRSKFKLSYVKKDGEFERNPYYLLQLLGAEKKPYIDTMVSHSAMDVSDIILTQESHDTYQIYDYYRYRICKYRFLLETLVEDTTIYKDNFLQMKYLEVLLENKVKEELQGLPVSEVILLEKLDEAFDELKRFFPYARNINRIDAINNIRGRIMANKSRKFPVLKKAEKEYMMIRELFIHKQLEDIRTHRKNILCDKFPDITREKLEQELSTKALENQIYYKNPDLWCQYCSNRESCAAYYTQITD